MKEGQRWLIETEMTVSEIAYMLGYEQSSNFSTAFKKKFGISPLSVRGEKQKFCSVTIRSVLQYARPADHDRKYHIYHYRHTFAYLWHKMEKREENTLQP